MDYASFVQWRAISEGVDLPSFSDRLGRPEWQRFARCRGEGTDVFFGTQGADTGPAKALCAECAVVGPCLEYALEDPSLDGVWGGMSTRERRRIRAAGHRDAA